MVVVVEIDDIIWNEFLGIDDDSFVVMDCFIFFWDYVFEIFYDGFGFGFL